MLLHCLLGAALLAAPPQDTDTTFAVRPSLRLNVSNFEGEIVIRTWGRDQVRVRADHDSDDRILIERTSSEVLVRAASWARVADEFDIVKTETTLERRGRRPRVMSDVSYDITVPETMALVLGGPNTDVTVEGSRGEVTVKVSEGNVEVHGGRGRISLASIEGDIDLYDAEGEVKLFSLDGSVTVERVSGRITVETTDGDITLLDVRSTGVEATSTDGDIELSGTIDPQGSYSFSSHDGDIELTLPPSTGARFTIATWEGEVSSDFPMTLPERFSGRRLSFTIGSGKAQVEIETFAGDIDITVLEDGGR
jgi:hypothetical protein